MNPKFYYLSAMNAAGYTRISREDQSKNSLESQERQIREYCTRNNLNLKAVFTDNGQSSYTFDRPDFKALEAFLKKNKDIQYLIVTDPSRFSRNTAEALMKLKELEGKMKIRVYATTDAFGTDFSDPSAFILRTLQYVMGESELHNIRKRTRAGLLQGKLNGRFMSSAPYGYKNARDVNDKAILKVDETRAKIVRFVFREFLNGMTITEIGIAARKMGFSPKGKSAIQRVLGNCAYCGLITIPDYKDRKSRFVQGLHEPIISEFDYWLVQEKLVHKPKGTSKNIEVPLRGVLRCWCGRKLTAGNSRSKTGAYHWYYFCMTHKENWPAKKLHPQFASLLDGLSFSPASLTWFRTHLEAQIEKKVAGQDEEIKSLSRDLKAVQLQIQTAEKRFLSGLVQESTFQEVILDLRATEARLQNSIRQAGAFGTEYYQRINRLLPALSNLRESFENMPVEKQQQFISQVFYDTFHYQEGIYRTQFLHPAFSHNELVLKEKGLLLIGKPMKKVGDQPRQGPIRDHHRTLVDGLMEILELIA